MEIDSLIVFASIIALASISPGPNVLAVIVHTVEAGFRGAIFTILGNLLALFSIAAVAAVGVEALIHSVPNAFFVMKIVGALYLSWMGIKMIKSSFGITANLEMTNSVSLRKSNVGYFVKAMLISYSNPKSILFLSAVFPTFLDSSSPTIPQFTTMFIALLVIVLSIHGAYALIALRMRDGLVGQKARKFMARLSGVTFVGIGIGLVYDTQK